MRKNPTSEAVGSIQLLSPMVWVRMQETLRPQRPRQKPAASDGNIEEIPFVSGEEEVKSLGSSVLHPLIPSRSLPPLEEG